MEIKAPIVESIGSTPLKNKNPQLDDATTALLQQMVAAGGQPLHMMTVEDAREMSAGLGQICGVGPEMAHIYDETITTKDSSFKVRVLVPKGTPRAVMVYYHGGGWVLGTIDSYQTLGQVIAERTQCAVVLVDYRLAPEFRYPTAAEDSYAALQWVFENITTIAGKTVPLVVAGDSAGGNLSAVVSLFARDRQGPEIALQILVYPVTGYEVDNESHLDPNKQALLSREGMVWFWDHYVPNLEDRRSLAASPLYVEDLSDLPPAVVLTAEFDPLRDEGEAYAGRLVKAGVPVTFRRFHDQMHGFFQLINVLPGADQGIAFIKDAMDTYLIKKSS